MFDYYTKIFNLIRFHNILSTFRKAANVFSCGMIVYYMDLVGK